MTERKIRADLSVFDTEVSQFRGSLQKNQVFHILFRLAVVSLTEIWGAIGHYPALIGAS